MAMTHDIAAALIAVAVVMSLLTIGVVMLDRAERRRRAAWSNHYFNGGGLVRALIARWPRQARLTDQRPPDDEQSA